MISPKPKQGLQRRLNQACTCARCLFVWWQPNQRQPGCGRAAHASAYPVSCVISIFMVQENCSKSVANVSTASVNIYRKNPPWITLNERQFYKIFILRFNSELSSFFFFSFFYLCKLLLLPCSSQKCPQWLHWELSLVKESDPYALFRDVTRRPLPSWANLLLYPSVCWWISQQRLMKIQLCSQVWAWHGKYPNNYFSDVLGCAKKLDVFFFGNNKVGSDESALYNTWITGHGHNYAISQWQHLAVRVLYII